MALRAIELFAGAGMLGEGVRAGLAYLGQPYRTVCYVEREAHAAAVLAARIEDGSLDGAPVWADVCTFDARRWRGAVDCIVAGFPCQDLSVAGQRAGLDGKRSGLFFEILRIADDCEARVLCLENVSGIASASATHVDPEEGELEERAAAAVLGALADSGWDAEWLTLSASDVGASHGRARWFCVAWRGMGNTECIGRRKGRPEHAWQQGRSTFVSADGALADAERQRSKRRRDAGDMDSASCDAEAEARQRQWRGHAADGGECGMADADRSRLRSIGRSEVHRVKEQGRDAQFCRHTLFAPGPNDPAWLDILCDSPWLAPALSADECTALAKTQPVLCGVVDGLAPGLVFSERAQRLKLCGNGVVAAQAAVAVVELVRRAGIFNTDARDDALRECKG